MKFSHNIRVHTRLCRHLKIHFFLSLKINLIISLLKNIYSTTVLNKITENTTQSENNTQKVCLELWMAGSRPVGNSHFAFRELNLGENVKFDTRTFAMLPAFILFPHIRQLSGVTLPDYLGVSWMHEINLPTPRTCWQISQIQWKRTN